ncbi:hypothetical protein ACFO0C_08245 [Actinoplanes subglobosus]|uniref:Uncharacterized protein n=1 Tax=Actinoplanes subglobosus TaxID=1547892 RepID=A0ABV8IRB5_9ACTN
MGAGAPGRAQAGREPGGAAKAAAVAGKAGVGKAGVGTAGAGKAGMGTAGVGTAGVGTAGVGAAGTASVGGGAATGGASGRVVAGARVGAPGVPDEETGGTRTGTVGRPGPEDASAPEGGGRWASAELRHKLRTQRRLRLVTLMSLAALVLLILPAFFGVRAATSDPVLASLDALEVPAWASKNDKDFETGNSLCLGVCEFRERVSDSDQSFAETTKVYSKALEKAGWSERKVQGCPEMPVKADEGTYTCWQRDELTLDLAVGLPGCAVDQVSAEGNPQAGAEAPVPVDPASCVGSTVSIKVWNAIEDERGKTDPAPGPQGVQPDAVLPTDDSIFQQTEPTPATS